MAELFLTAIGVWGVSGLFLVLSQPHFHWQTFTGWYSSRPSDRAPVSAEDSASAGISAAPISIQSSPSNFSEDSLHFFNDLYERVWRRDLERPLP